jgi:hypothetical protein
MPGPRSEARVLTRRQVASSVLLIVAALGAAAEGRVDAPAKPLRITADFCYPIDPAPPKDWRLDAYAKALIVQRTGVDATWVNSSLTGKSGLQLITEWIASDTTPEVLLNLDIFGRADLLEAWTGLNMSWRWDAGKIRSLLPGYTARLAKYGLPVEELLRFNTVEGENWYIPIGLTFQQLPALRSLDEAKAADQNYYAVGLRDDVLKRIFPDARTETDLLAVYVRKGRLTPQDIVSDIPLKTLQDLRQYLRRVKTLNLKVGDKPLIPAALCASSESVGSIDWSLRTAIGYHWSWPLVFANPPTFEGSFFIRASAEYREYLRWWNTLYNEGLLDPEIFVMKDDQYRTKVINGEYAVINFWIAVDEARRAGRERGYGYRFFPLFYGQLKPAFSNTMGYLSLRAAPLNVTRSVSAADLPRVARWVDWYLSEERDVLASWGTPDMYTGSGRLRRYRPDFEGLEAWAVYGATGEKDGPYYGLRHAWPAIASDPLLPLGGISFFDRRFTYPEAPYFVCPRDPAKDAARANVWKIAADVIYRTVWDDHTQWTYAENPSGLDRTIPGMKEWTAFTEEHAAETHSFVVKMVTGRAADFDRNYAGFLKIYEDAGTAALEREGIAWMADYYRREILPNMIKK